MNIYYNILWCLLYPFVRFYFRLNVTGLDYLPPSGPYLIASNHTSYLDPPIVALSIPDRIAFLAKKELFNVPFFGWYIFKLGANPVERNSGDVKAVRTVLRLLKANERVLIFPEGTRSKNGRLQPLETGLAWIALKADVPIVPLYIRGTYEAFSRDMWFPRPKKVRVAIGPALVPSKEGEKTLGKENVEIFSRQIEASLATLEGHLQEKDS